MSLKETKRGSAMDTDSVGLPAMTSTIHVGPIVNPERNDTISIVIPFSTQLAMIQGRSMDRSCRDSVKIEMKEDTNQMSLDPNCPRPQIISQQSLSLPITHGLTQSLAQTLSHSLTSTQAIKNGKPVVTSTSQPRADKTKGCPFPTCSRYGRAFSRAHDLKRHIARHDMRKERLSDTIIKREQHTCAECGEAFLNDAILQRHARVHLKNASTVASVSLESAESTRPYACHLCKKKYANESKLKAHLVSHEKKGENNVCSLCGCQFDQEEKLQHHMREHTTSILQAQEALNKPSDKSTQVKEEDDDFMLEEMLLLNKNPRINGLSGSGIAVASSASSSTSSSGNNKIRCDYCSKTFKTKWTLSSHVAAHEGRFQFGCTRCGKKFVRKSHFEGHVRSHEAARPYVCEQCGKTFKELKHRREHTKRKHPGNQNAIQNLLDSISACVSEDSSVDQAKFTLLMPINFGA